MAMPALPSTSLPATVDVEIEKLVYGGEGLGRVDGQVILIPFVLPDELVQTQAQRVKTGLLRGAAPTILKPAPERVPPPCQYFGGCGGCQYQHAGYNFQLRQKRAILLETLERLAGLSFTGDIHSISAEPWGYRNRIQLHFDGRRSGFHRLGSHDLFPIDHCHITAPRLVEAIRVFAEAVRAPQWPRFLHTLELFTNGRELQLTVTDSGQPVAARFFEWCGTLLPDIAPAALEYSAAGFNFRISRGSFFQVNRFLINKLVEEALLDLNGHYALDLYAGVGLFSLPLARHFTRVDAIERGGPAYRDLNWNSAQFAANVRSIKGSAEEFLRDLEETPALVIADPPRAGIGKEATEHLLRLRPPHLVIVSCDPTTLSRDLKKLLAAYDITRLTLVDLFPQTYHFETVAHLQLKAG
jgi:23S rRNA (uracil1939-C5)-methyltransferase